MGHSIHQYGFAALSHLQHCVLHGLQAGAQRDGLAGSVAAGAQRQRLMHRRRRMERPPLHIELRQQARCPHLHHRKRHRLGKQQQAPNHMCIACPCAELPLRMSCYALTCSPEDFRSEWARLRDPNAQNTQYPNHFLVMKAGQ